MIIKKVILVSAILLMSACGPSRDTDLEIKISQQVDSKEIVAISNFGQVVVNISSASAFEMEQNSRQELAMKLAKITLESHPDASAILIGFGRTKPEIQQIAYGYKNENGKLSLIQQ